MDFRRLSIELPDSPENARLGAEMLQEVETISLRSWQDRGHKVELRACLIPKPVKLF